MSSKNRFGEILEIAKQHGEATPYAEEGDAMPAEDTLRRSPDTHQEQPGKRGRPKGREAKQCRLYPDHGLYPHEYPQKCQDRVN